MLKKLVAFGLAAVMLCGCGSENETAESTQKNENVTETEQAEVSSYPEYLNLDSARPVVNEGEDNGCIFEGCRIYDNGVLNSSLDSLLSNGNIDFNTINETEGDITTDNPHKDTIYNKGDLIYNLTCKSNYEGEGYTLKCNGNDEIILEGEGCKQYCNELSPVYDKNGYKVSTQLLGLNFANRSTQNDNHNFRRCLNTYDNTITTLNGSNFVVEIGTEASCDKIQSNNYFSDISRIVICTADTNNKNNGKPYWQMEIASCDLSLVRNKGYNIILGDKNGKT